MICSGPARWPHMPLLTGCRNCVFAKHWIREIKTEAGPIVDTSIDHVRPESHRPFRSRGLSLSSPERSRPRDFAPACFAEFCLAVPGAACLRTHPPGRRRPRSGGQVIAPRIAPLQRHPASKIRNVMAEQRSTYQPGGAGSHPARRAGPGGPARLRGARCSVRRRRCAGSSPAPQPRFPGGTRAGRRR